MDFETLAALPDERISLADAALSLAEPHYPGLARGRYLSMLNELGIAAKAELAAERGPEAKFERFISYLHEDQGFQGNAEHYYDPRNSYLNEVLERRLGIPITLAVIWIEVARRAEFDLRGVSFPGHFLVRSGDILADPFYGRIIDEDECRRRLAEAPGAPCFRSELLDPASNRQILSRMLGNLKHIYLNSNDPRSALECCDKILVLFPDSATERRDRGLINLSLERFSAAMSDFETFLAMTPADPSAPVIKEKLAALQQKVAGFH